MSHKSTQVLQSSQVEFSFPFPIKTLHMICRHEIKMLIRLFLSTLEVVPLQLHFHIVSPWFNVLHFSSDMIQMLNRNPMCYLHAFMCELSLLVVEHRFLSSKTARPVVRGRKRLQPCNKNLVETALQPVWAGWKKKTRFQQTQTCTV